MRYRITVSVTLTAPVGIHDLLFDRLLAGSLLCCQISPIVLIHCFGNETYFATTSRLLLL